MIAFALKAIGYLKLIPKPVWYALGIVAALLLLWRIHAGWEHTAYNEAYNAGVAKQKVLTEAEIQKNAVNLASINTLQSALAEKNAESERRAKAFADAKAADAASLAEMDKRQKADASRLETLQRLARDLPENPQCRVPCGSERPIGGIVMRYLMLASIALLAGCGDGSTPPPAVEVRTVVKTVEVAKPCPVTKPTRPAPLPKPMPTDLSRFAATLAAKLVEWAGPGGYGDRADAAITECTKP